MSSCTCFRNDCFLTHLLCLSVFDALDGDLDLVPFFPSPRDFCVELELESLLGADPLKPFGHFHVDAHATHVSEELDGCDLGAQARPNRPKFDTNDASADQDHLLGNFAQAQSARRRHNGFLVNLE